MSSAQVGIDKARLKREVKAGKPGAAEELERLREGEAAATLPHGQKHWQAKGSRSTQKERRQFLQEQKDKEQGEDTDHQRGREAEGGRQDPDEDEDLLEQRRLKKLAKEDAKSGKKSAIALDPDPSLTDFQAKAAERDKKMKEAQLAAKLEAERLHREKEELQAKEERLRLALKRQAFGLPRLEAKVRRECLRVPLEGWAVYKRDMQHGAAVISSFAGAHTLRPWFRQLRNLAQDRKHSQRVERVFARSVDLSLLCEVATAWQLLVRSVRGPVRRAGLNAGAGAWAPGSNWESNSMRGHGSTGLPVDSQDFEPAWPLARSTQEAAMQAEWHYQQSTQQQQQAAAAAASLVSQQLQAQHEAQLRAQQEAEARARDMSVLSAAAEKVAEGRALSKSGCTLDALQCFEEALRLRTGVLGEGHPLSVEALYESGLVCPDKQRAVELLLRCVDLEVASRGELHAETGQCMLGAGMTMWQNGSESEALWMLARAANTFEATTGHDDARFKRAVATMLDIM